MESHEAGNDNGSVGLDARPNGNGDVVKGKVGAVGRDDEHVQSDDGDEADANQPVSMNCS